MPRSKSARVFFCSAALRKRRKVLEPLREIVVVLLREYGGRHEEDDLIALLHHLKGRAERNFGLAVAHVAANQAVHDSSLFEVRLDIRNRLQLVPGLRVGEELLELGLPHRIRPGTAASADAYF